MTMAVRGKISELFDLEAIEGQQKTVNALVDEFIRKTANVKPIKVNLEGAEKTKDAIKGVNDLGVANKEYERIIKETAAAQVKLSEIVVKQKEAEAKAIADNTKAIKDEGKAADDSNKKKATSDKKPSYIPSKPGEAGTFKGIPTPAGSAVDEKTLVLRERIEGQSVDLYASYSAEARALAELKLQQQLVNKANKESAQETLGLIGPHERLNLQYQALVKSARNAAIEFGEDSDEYKSVSSEAGALGERLRKIDLDLKQFGRNVGNYAGSLGPAFNVLDKALQEVKKKIDDLTASGKQDAAVMETLQREYELLQTLVDAQSKGFKTATSEIRNNQQAIVQLSKVYGEDSSVVQELISETAELVDTVGDLKASVKARASDTQVFDGLISAAQGLAGAYGVAQGAAALLGDNSDELAKTMVKLQAVMSVLQGLQAIQNVLQKENQARQLAAVILNKIVTFQTTLQTAAESKSIIVRYAAAAAQRTLNFAMSAAGGPILGVLAVIGLLLASFTSFGATTRDITIDVKKFGEEADLAFSQADRAQRKLSQSNAVAVSEAKKRFATDSELRAIEKKGLADQLKVQDETITKLAPKEAQLVKLQKDMREGRKDLDEQQFNDAKDILLKLRDARDKKIELEQQLSIKENDNARANTVEAAQIRRADLDLTVADLNTRADALKRIAADETKSYGDRIKASNGFFQQQIRITELQKKQALDNPELKPEDRAKIINDAANKEIILIRDRNKAKEDFQKQAADRERAARVAIIKTELEDRVKSDELITDNEKKSFDDRFNAAYDAYNRRRDLLTVQRNLDIQNDKLTTEERKAIEVKYTSDVNQITVDYGLKQLELYKVNQEQITALIEKENEKRKNIIDTNQANAITALNEQFQQGKISVEEYNKARTDIEQRYAIESLQNDVRNAFAKVLATKEGTAARYEAEKELAEKTAALSDATTRKQIENEQKLKEYRQQAYSEAYSTITSLVDGSFDNEKNKVQAQIDDLDKQTQAKIEAVNRELITDQEKADKTAVINARAAAQKETLERKQRQLDAQRARFDKAANIAKIIGDTAVAIINQLRVTPLPAGLPFIAAIGAIGALQLTRAIAAPIPQFAEGTDDAPGGPAWVGDGGRRELVVTPEGRMMITPSTPTLWNIPRHSVVLPDLNELMDFTLDRTHANMLAATAYRPAGQDISDIISRQFEREGNRIVQAILNKREHNFHWSNGQLQQSVKNGMDHYKYLDDNLNF
jgi:hypothetical protein